jgi:hypothetical protein
MDEFLSFDGYSYGYASEIYAVQAYTYEWTMDNAGVAHYSVNVWMTSTDLSTGVPPDTTDTATTQRVGFWDNVQGATDLEGNAYPDCCASVDASAANQVYSMLRLFKPTH